MSYYETPVADFEPHPEGNHRGVIVDVIDKGMVETKFGTKPKISIQIASETAAREDEEPCQIWLWCTLSGSRKSKLYELRRCLAGRELTDKERAGFDDAELLGKRLGYLVTHNRSDDGERVFSNVASFWPVSSGQNTKEPEAESNAGPPEKKDEVEAALDAIGARPEELPPVTAYGEVPA